MIWPTPTKPGFYWAKWRLAEDASTTSIGVSDRWEVVEVERGDLGYDAEFIVSVAGEPIAQPIENFFWGPGPLEPPK